MSKAQESVTKRLAHAHCCTSGCRSVGTFARALDCTSTVRQPSLHMSAAAASRDVTLVSTEVVCPFESLPVLKAMEKVSLLRGLTGTSKSFGEY